MATVNYAFDAANRRTQMSVTDQTAVTYAWDNASRLSSMTRGSEIVSYGYDTSNRRTSLTLGNGIIGTYVYDAGGQLSSLTYKKATTTIGDLLYTYDTGGRITAINGTLADNALPPQTPANASYDLANRLTNWKSQPIPYDLNGNMTTVPAAAANTGQAMTYLWDARNRLEEVKTNGATTASFTYDAFGRRQQKSLTANVGATTTTVNTLFTYDGHNPIQERNGALGTKPVTANIRTGLGIDEFISRRTRRAD